MPDEETMIRLIEERRQKWIDAIQKQEYAGTWITGAVALGEVYIGCSLIAKEVYSELYRVGHLVTPDNVDPEMWKKAEIDRISHELFAKIPLQFAAPQQAPIFFPPSGMPPPPGYVPGGPAQC